MKAFFMDFFVWFSYDVTVENEFVTITRQSSMSAYVIFDSFLLYLFSALSCLSTAYVNAVLTAFSGLPPCSRKLEL